MIGVVLFLFGSVALGGDDAAALMRSGRLQEAVPVARAEAEAAPQNLDAQERFIDLMLQLGLTELAVEPYRSRLRAHPDDPDAHYLVGRAVTSLDAARREYEAALALAPAHARAEMGMGAIHRSLGEHADAETAYAAAVAADPSLIEAWTGLAYSRLAQDHAPDALIAARSAEEHVPRAAEGYLIDAVLDPSHAEATLRTGEKATGADPRIEAALAEIYLARGDGSAAAKSAKAALAVDPSRPDARLSALFASCMSAGHLDADGYQALLTDQRLETTDGPAARADYDRLQPKYPKCALIPMSRARVEAAAGDAASAEADLTKALQLDPGNLEATAAKGLLLADIRPADARPLLSRAAEALPTDASLAVAAAKAELATGAIDAAKTRMDAAIVTWPWDVRVVLVHAQVTSATGDREAAYQALLSAAQRFPDARIVLALAAAAKDAGHVAQAADILEQIGRQTGHPEFERMADELRKNPSAQQHAP
jgi:tetratricopeptide (TPR) repeat protein